MATPSRLGRNKGMREQIDPRNAQMMPPTIISKGNESSDGRVSYEVSMFILRSCHRCGGDLYSNRDIYGDYGACLQCGYYLHDAEVLELWNAVTPQHESVAEYVREQVLVGAERH
jgi:hypothetical protein